MQDVAVRLAVDVTTDTDHVIVLGMPGMGKEIARFKLGQRLRITKVNIQQWDYYVIEGVPESEFGMSVMRQFLDTETVRMLRALPVHEYWDHE
jgi:hypothetical protein